jgi:hypothetical protein
LFLTFYDVPFNKPNYHVAATAVSKYTTKTRSTLITLLSCASVTSIEHVSQVCQHTVLVKRAKKKKNVLKAKI